MWILITFLGNGKLNKVKIHFCSAPNVIIDLCTDVFINHLQYYCAFALPCLLFRLRRILRLEILLNVLLLLVSLLLRLDAFYDC